VVIVAEEQEFRFRFLGMYSVLTFLPEFVQTPSAAGYGFGASITGSGVFLLPMTVTMFLGRGRKRPAS
jgi:hypothetical protein